MTEQFKHVQLDGMCCAVRGNFNRTMSRPGRLYSLVQRPKGPRNVRAEGRAEWRSESCAPKLQVVVEGGGGRAAYQFMSHVGFGMAPPNVQKSLCYLDLPRLEKPVEAQLWSLVRRHVVGRATMPACTSF